MPEIRFTEEDHAFAQEFVDRLESSGVAGNREVFLTKEDADWAPIQTERHLAKPALMMRLAEAVQWAARQCGLCRVRRCRKASSLIPSTTTTLEASRSDEDYKRRYALGVKLPPNPDQNVGGSVVVALRD